MSHWFLLVNGGSSIIHQQVESLSFRFREELGLPKMSAQIFFRRYLTTDFQATAALLIVGFIEVVTHTPFFASQPEGLKFRFPRATPAAYKTYVRALPGVKSYVTRGLLWNKLSFIQKTLYSALVDWVPRDSFPVMVFWFLPSHVNQSCGYYGMHPSLPSRPNTCSLC